MTALHRPLPSDDSFLATSSGTGVPAARASSEADPLYPLSELLQGERPDLLDLLEMGGPAMPEPYRRLLVHERDMTSTLERFHAEAAGLDQLQRRRDGSDLWREVLLIGQRSGRVMEYGAIRIDLAGFGSDARFAILEGRRPLGTILADYRVAYRSRPGRFFSLRSTARLESLLGLESEQILFGRQNVLLGPQGPLAEVVEILPPSSIG